MPDRLLAPLAAAALVIGPPAATALYFLWARGRCCRLRQAWRSADAVPVNNQLQANQLMRRLQAALRAEGDRRLRIALLVQGTVWAAFCVLFGPELWVAFCDQYSSLGVCARAGPREMASHPFVPVFVLGCSLALRPTDKIAMNVVYFLMMAFISGLVYQVRCAPTAHRDPLTLRAHACVWEPR